MTTILDKPLKRFRAAPVRGGDPKVNRTGGHFGAGLIVGASVITRGEALGHYMWVDQESVEKVAKLGNKARNGIKARFTHPGLSGDGLGTLLGRFKNFRVDGNKAIADLHFEKSSHETPDGDLAKYVMDLAEEDPEALATSIVFDPDYGEEDRFEAEHEDEDGIFQSPDDDNTKNYRHMRIAKLWATDVVDEPAANPDGLFRKGQEIAEEADALCEYALGLSSERPALRYLSADADRLAQYAARFLDSHHLELRSNQMPDTKPNQDAPASVTTEQLNSFGEKLLSQVDERITKALANTPKGELLTTDPPADNTAERKRCKEIYSLAATSGLEDFAKVADEAIDGGVTVEQFKAALSLRRIATNGLTKDSGEQASDPDVKYKKEYQQQRAAFVAMGLTEKEYIIGRKIDDGAELLAYVPKENAA
jgi:hypothetical protein